MAYKVLLTENTSRLGARLSRDLENHDLAVRCPELSVSDWGDSQCVRSLLRDWKPAVILDTLHYAHVLEAQSNAGFRCVLAKECCEVNVPVIHLGSHKVFGFAQHNERLEEDLEPIPDSPEGEAFRATELAFLQSPSALILRLPWLVDGDDQLLASICQQLHRGAGINVSDAWMGSVTDVKEASRVVVAIMQQILCKAQNWGVMHLRSSDQCSEAELVDYISRTLVKAGASVSDISLVPVDQRFIASCGHLMGARCADGFGIQYANWRHGIKSKVQAWLKNATKGDSADMQGYL